MIVRQRRDIASVQILRGIAATMVVVFHCHTDLGRMGHELPALIGLSWGVDIFFVISGFVMWVSTEHAPGRTASRFLLDRMIRIVPLYWIMTLGLAGFALTQPGMLQSTIVDPSHLLKSLFFLAAPNPYNGEYLPVLIPGWTLNLEMFFYLLFAISIAFSMGDRKRRGLIVTGLILAASAVPLLMPSAPGAILFYGRSIILEFLCGVGLGIIYVQRLHRESAWWWMLCAAGWILMGISALRGDLPHFFAAGLPAAMIVAGAVFAQPANLPLRWLGDISYSLYLSHGMVVSAVGRFWRSAGLTEMPPWLFILAATAAAILAGAAIYYWLERPLTRGLKSLAATGKTKPVLA